LDLRTLGMAPNIRSMHDLRKLEDSRDSINKEQVQKYEQVMKLLMGRN